MAQLDSEILRKLSELISDRTGISPSHISGHTNLTQLARFDAIARAGLALDIQEEFGVDIDDQTLEQLQTVMGFVDCILRGSTVSSDVNAFIQQCVEGLRLQTLAHTATWKLGQERNWSLDQDTGTIEFQFADGTKATARVQIVGTLNQADSTFLWAWDHPSVEVALRDHAERVHRYGQEHHVQHFTTRKLVCTEQEAWEFTAVAVRLGQASGAYRAKASGTLVFVTFGEVEICHDRSA